MQINRPVANDAAARECDGRFLAPTQQRSKHTNRSAHFSDDVVGRDAVDLLSSHSDSAAGAFYLRAEVSENLKHVICVAQVGYPVNDTWFPRQQCRGENRQRGIL